jgi:SAM-dependent methyltransferase
MTQNIYDDPGFFARYTQLPRQVEGLAAAPEWPALRAWLPEMQGKRVLDLGCGFGWFCRWAREHGAAQALGVDVSEQMLARARTMTTDAAILYARMDMEQPGLPQAAFDVAYSSLALHYIARLDRLLAEVHRALVPGGHLVFSVEHPIITAPTRQEWIADGEDRKVWPLDRYLDEGPRSRNWMADGVIKQHRTIGTYVNTLLGTGFVLTHMAEWAPDAAQIAQHPDWADERHRPPFLLMAARKI